MDLIENGNNRWYLLYEPIENGNNRRYLLYRLIENGNNRRYLLYELIENGNNRQYLLYKEIYCTFIKYKTVESRYKIDPVSEYIQLILNIPKENWKGVTD